MITLVVDVMTITVIISIIIIYRSDIAREKNNASNNNYKHGYANKNNYTSDNEIILVMLITENSSVTGKHIMPKKV